MTILHPPTQAIYLSLHSFQVDFVELKNQKVLDEFQKVLKQNEIPPTVTATPTAVVQIGDIAKQNVRLIGNDQGLRC